MAKGARRSKPEALAADGRAAAWRRGDGCVIVRVRVTPKSSKTKVDGVGETAEGPAVLVRVTSVPENGAANAAVEELLAQWLDLPRRAASVVAGHRSRLKTVAIGGVGGGVEERLAAAIDRLAAEPD